MVEIRWEGPTAPEANSEEGDEKRSAEVSDKTERDERRDNQGHRDLCCWECLGNVPSEPRSTVSATYEILCPAFATTATK